MHSFMNDIKSTILKHKMIETGDSIVIGVSGGADSLCLLHVLNSLKTELDITLFAVHLNHQFRGLDADEDADFVEQICNQWNIPHRIERFDVPAYAKQQGLSPEEAGREIRYKLFRETKENVGADKIAVAQNLNDNVETVMMRMLRGTGLEGLKGIDPVRDDIIRPLLESSRESIEAYCKENLLEPRVDKTNLQPIYLRNKIRLELLPYLRHNFNQNINDALLRMAYVARDDNDFLELQSNELFLHIAHVDEQCIKINKEELQSQHSAMKNRLIRKAVEHAAGTLNGFEYKHFQGVSDLLNKTTGAAIELPKNIRAMISYENLIICKKIENPDKKCYYKLKYNCDNKLEEPNMTISMKLIDMKELSAIPKSSTTVYLDVSKIKTELILRNREPGDVISPIGMRGSKKLKDYLIDKKIPKDTRNELLFLADGSEIVWILGSIISEKYKVTTNTEKVLIVTCDMRFIKNNIKNTREEVTCKMT